MDRPNITLGKQCDGPDHTKNSQSISRTALCGAVRLGARALQELTHSFCTSDELTE